MSAPKVFISYSHDSPEHKLWVLELATRLRSSGVDAILDQWDIGPGGDLAHFMERGIADSSRILMLCTGRYVEKANAGIGGVGYEKMIVTAELMKRIDSAKVIPIICQQSKSLLPTFLGTKFYIDLSNRDYFETGFDQLLRDLLGAPLFVKPPLGTVPVLSSRSTPNPTQPTPLTQFMAALTKAYESSYDSGGVRTEKVRQAMGVTKLFFDHARDLALQEKYITSSGTMEYMWVQQKGRDEMMRLVTSKS